MVVDFTIIGGLIFNYHSYFLVIPNFTRAFCYVPYIQMANLLLVNSYPYVKHSN